MLPLTLEWLKALYEQYSLNKSEPFSLESISLVKTLRYSCKTLVGSPEIRVKEKE